MDIKLRCYSKRKQQMFYPTDFRIKFNRDGSKHVLLCLKEEPDKHYEKKEDYALMASTTLSDSFTNKLIYEGDIVSSHPESGEIAQAIYQIEWSNGQWWCVRYVNSEPVVDMWEPFPLASNYAKEQLKVIGNIYEGIKA